MTRTLPVTPNLEQLKHQAKDLLRAYRNQDPEARLRLLNRDVSPAGNLPSVTLATVQHIIAREYGFERWPKLKKHIEILTANAQQRAYLQQQVERFRAPVCDWRTLLAASEELDRAGQAGLEAAIEGLSHPSPRVRRECAGYMDHLGTDACVSRLRFVALHDPVPNVRRYRFPSSSQLGPWPSQCLLSENQNAGSS
jgi:hypothetical protein